MKETQDVLKSGNATSHEKENSDQTDSNTVCFRNQDFKKMSMRRIGQNDIFINNLLFFVVFSTIERNT